MILFTQFAQVESFKLAEFKKHLLKSGEKKFEVWQLPSLPSPDSLAMIHYNFKN